MTSTSRADAVTRHADVVGAAAAAGLHVARGHPRGAGRDVRHGRPAGAAGRLPAAGRPARRRPRDAAPRLLVRADQRARPRQRRHRDPRRRRRRRRRRHGQRRQRRRLQPQGRPLDRRLAVPPAGRDRRPRPDAAARRLRGAGCGCWPRTASGTDLLHDADLTGRRTPGSWATRRGASPEVRDACDEVVRVPIHGSAESLNLAMAATVCLYASATAQRGVATSG